MTYCRNETGREFADHTSFYRFSVEEFRTFWSNLLTWSGIAYDGSPVAVCAGDDVEHARFFPDLRLNYVENLLATHAERDDQPALVARRANGTRVELSRRDLRAQVMAVAAALQRDGLRPGDRVVAISSNNDRLVVAGLAALAVGATLSTAAPDMGVDSVLSRFAQLSPTILLCETGGAEAAERLDAIVDGLPTLRRVVVLDDGDVPAGSTVSLDELLTASRGAVFEWPRLPFNHPLFILFSSGTTGPPKCIVHAAGGTLLEHIKEHRLHGDLRPDDVLFFQTSPAWMMWNWQLSALAVGATIVLNAGAVVEPAALWSVVEAERVSVFGTSPAYLRLCEVEGFSPRTVYGLARLRLLMSTGAVLADTQYDWVAQHVGDLAIHSISGGTDIVGCFVLGAPDLPIRRGETQCRSLGLDVRALDPDAAGIGELVCCSPFPSRPTGLYGDADRSRFHQAYFAANEGMWTHGDLIEITERGSARMHGRSDSVLNVGGIRIGPAEIYTIVNRVPGVAESLVVEQRIDDGAESSRLVLLVVMTEPGLLDANKQAEIRAALRAGAGVHHVPRVIAEVTELPRTFSGKPSESAVRNTLNGVPVRNAGALRNPDSLAAAAQAVHRADTRTVLTSVEGSSLVDQLCAVFAEILGVDEVQPEDSFFDIGGTSLMLVAVRRLLYDRVGHDVPLSTIFRAPRAEELARLLGDEGGLRDTLVLLRAGAGVPVFAIHDGSGDVLTYRLVATELDCDRPVYGIRARELDGQSAPDISIEAMARSALRTIRAVQPYGPFTIVGYSFGGLVAFEAARALEREGECANLILLDTYLGPRASGLLRGLWFVAVVRNLRWCASLFGSDRTVAFQTIRKRARRFQLRRSNSNQPLPPSMPPTPRAWDYWRRVRELTRQYRPVRYGGDVTLLMAREQLAFKVNPVPIWQAATGGRLCVVQVPGDHITAVQGSNATILASELDRILREQYAWDHIVSDPQAAQPRAS